MPKPAVATSSVLKAFNTPADVVDFPNDPASQTQMNQLWNDNVTGWLTAAQYGDLWDLVNYGPRPLFYNPLVTETPSDAAIAPIPWNAFPGRLSALFPNQGANWNQWADTGQIPNMTNDLCSGPISPTPYDPTGPRGWQDEYCEWSVNRDPASNEILSVMFTCENPEYWLSLWQVSPQAVLTIYQNLVNSAVTLDDLSLTDSSGAFVTDPANGNQRVYNPLNKWNRGTQTLPTSGGAMHLTSSPNTLGAEFDLAAAATMPRVDGQGQPITATQPLICCAKYGRPGRHSDPTIGASVNATVNPQSGGQLLATLTNPPGLYMQTPDWTLFSSMVIPNAQQFAASCWTVVRGKLADPSNPNDIDRILHATFTIPAGTKASDLLVNGQPLQYGSQIASAITMKLSATAFPSTTSQAGVACTASNQNPAVSVSAIQSLSVFQAYRALELQMNEIPFSVPILALRVAPGATLTNMAIALNIGVPDSPQSAQITVQGGGVSIDITGQATAPGNIPVLTATITVDSNATPGPRGILANVPGMPSLTQPALGLLVVTQPSELRAQTKISKRLMRFGHIS